MLNPLYTLQQLTPLVSGNHFWFAWAVFKPETRVILESDVDRS